MYQKFEELLKKSGKTVYQFCKETGITQSTISSWKNRGVDSSVTTCTLKKLCDYFGVPADYFLDRKE